MLPTHGGARQSNGLSGIPTVNKHVLVSIAWLLISLLVASLGVYHCRSNGYTYTLKCDQTLCMYTTNNVAELKDYTWQRADFLDVYQGKVVKENERVRDEDPETRNYVNEKKRRNRRRGGYTLQFEFQIAPEAGSRIKVIHKIPFTMHDLGRKKAKSHEETITKYKNGEINEVDITAVKRVTLVGMLAILAGFFSTVMSIALGIWKDPTPKRLKKTT